MIKIKNVKKSYDLGVSVVNALKGVDLNVERGDFLTIMGASGSGKSTLLHILGLLDLPSEGEYLIDNIPVQNLPDKELARIRNKHFGFIFQSFNLFNELNALENVMMPLIYGKTDKKDRKNIAVDLLKKVGLDHRITHYPNMLSGGEQQRVAIARALANNPDLILADEPTGNLPSEKGAEIMNLLIELNKQGTTIIMVTHDDKLGRCGNKKVVMKDGVMLSHELVENPHIPEPTCC
ncbi:MAG: ABC transporter ATP-binding protein [Spirochaetales bacterium]|nr:ABC transporter ATP-binding protein [Spirochaetales bacterium]